MKKIITLVFVLFITCSISWGSSFLVCDPQEGIIYYNIRINENRIMSQPAESDGSLRFDLSPFTSSREYLLKVSACNSRGCSDPSLPYKIDNLPKTPIGIRTERGN